MDIPLSNGRRLGARVSRDGRDMDIMEFSRPKYTRRATVSNPRYIFTIHFPGSWIPRTIIDTGEEVVAHAPFLRTKLKAWARAHSYQYLGN